MELLRTIDGTGLRVAKVPAGTDHVHLAYSEHAGPATDYSATDVPLATAENKLPVPASAAHTPHILYVSAIARKGTSELGAWTGWVAVPVAPVPTPKPEPPPSPACHFGLVNGGWDLTADPAIQGGKIHLMRLLGNTSPTLVAKYEAAGWKMLDLIGHNPATSQSPAGLAAQAVERAKLHPGIIGIELLNEPQNPYEGGSESQSNIEAYARLVNATADAFVANGIKAAVLWSCDGGYRGVSSWGAKVWPLLNANAKRIGRPTVHPYGGTSNREQSALGGRKRVEEAHALTGLKVWVTEVGWPTAVGQPSTGDSFQWSETEQANNFTKFAQWAPTYCEVVTFFQYRDYSTAMWYGVESKEGRHKPSLAVLESLT